MCSGWRIKMVDPDVVDGVASGDVSGGSVENHWCSVIVFGGGGVASAFPLVVYSFLFVG